MTENLIIKAVADIVKIARKTKDLTTINTSKKHFDLLLGDTIIRYKSDFQAHDKVIARHANGYTGALVARETLKISFNSFVFHIWLDEIEKYKKENSSIMAGLLYLTLKRKTIYGDL